MLQNTIQALAQKIYDLGFVSKACGIASELFVSAAGINKRVLSAPVAPFSDNRMFEVSPDRLESAITFFQAGPTRVIRQDVFSMTLENEVSLLGWINGDKVQSDTSSDPELLVIGAIRKARFSAEDESPIRSIEIDYSGSQTPDFSRFGWDDGKLQYGAYPHRLFHHTFRVVTVVSSGCSTASINVLGMPC